MTMLARGQKSLVRGAVVNLDNFVQRLSSKTALQTPEVSMWRVAEKTGKFQNWTKNQALYRPTLLAGILRTIGSVGNY